MSKLVHNYTTNNDPNNDGAKSGQLTGITDMLDATRNRAYTYDKLARLKEAKGGTNTFTSPTWAQTYSYDRYGNRQNVTMSGNPGTIPLDGITGLAYNTASNRLTNTNYEYDAAGNQTRGQVEGGAFKRSRYDAAGRLAEVRDDADTLQEKYSYGASNERLITTTGSTARYYAWDGGQTVAEYSGAVGSGTLTWQKSYVYAGGRLLATTTPGNNKQYHHPDRLGTRVITDTNGAFSGRQESLPYGAMIDTSAATTKRFTSYDRSATTKLDYAVNRFYNAAQGRFTQVDPIEMSAASLTDPQTLNLYAYCGNDPVNHTDPDGLDGGASLVVVVIQVISAVISALRALFGGKKRQTVKVRSAEVRFLTETGHNSGWERVTVQVGVGAVAALVQQRPELKRKGEADPGPDDSTQKSSSTLDKVISVLPVIVTGGINPLRAKVVKGSQGKAPYKPCESFMGVNANYMYRNGGDNLWGQSVRGHLLKEYKYRDPGWGPHLRAYGWATIRTSIIDTATLRPVGSTAVGGLATAVFRAGQSLINQTMTRLGEMAVRDIASMYPGTIQSGGVQGFPCREVR